MMRDTKSSGLITQPLGLLKAEKREIKWILQLLIPTLLGFLLPRVTVYGSFSPFGISLLAAVSGPTSIPVFIATALGYIVNSTFGTLRYLACLVSVIGLRWSVAGFPRISRSVWFAPTIAFLGCVITGSALHLGGDPSAIDILSVISESLLCSGFAYFCYTLFNYEGKQNRESTRLSAIVIAAISIMGLYSIQWQGINVGRILANLMMLVVAKIGLKEGSVVGILLGITCFFSAPEAIHWVSFYTVSGWLCGWFSCKKRFVSLVLMNAIYITVSAVSAGITDLPFIIGLYEILAGGALFYLIPTNLLDRLQRFFHFEITEKSSAPDIQKTVRDKMMSASATMSMVAGTMDTISKHFAKQHSEELGTMYLSVGESVCNNCKLKLSCWGDHFAECMDSLNHFTPVLKTQGIVTTKNVKGYLETVCPKTEEICSYVNCHYPEYLLRESTFRRLQELRHIVNDQFENTSQILKDFSKQLETTEWQDEERARRIYDDLQKAGFTIKHVLCVIKENGHQEVQIILNDLDLQTQLSKLNEIVEKDCKRVFAHQQIEKAKGESCIYFSESQVFRTVIGTSQSRCKGEKLCGDSFEIFRDQKGNQYVVLSDGMGTGGRAAVDSAITAGLTTELLKSGFGYESILRLVNTALIANSSDETLATLDIACINLFTGELELLKAGAGASLLLSKTRISRFEESSLPLGILHELNFARTRDRLSDGDILLMMSDGISNDGLRWIEELLRSFDFDAGNMQDLSEMIVKTALRMNQDDKGDDMTVIAIKVEKIHLPDLPL